MVLSILLVQASVNVDKNARIAQEWESRATDEVNSALTRCDRWRASSLAFEAKLKLCIETVVYVPYELEEWETLPEFKAWLVDNNTTAIPGDEPGDNINCTDYAARMQRVALEQGYAISVALVGPSGTYYGKRVREGGRGHAGCMVEIAGVYYYFEPYPWLDHIWTIVERY